MTRLPADLQFVLLEQMPYTDLRRGHEQYPSTWVDLPNAFCEPEVAARLWDGYMGEVMLAEQGGFDGVMITEHHSTSHNMNSSASVAAASLIPRTSRIKLFMAGVPITLINPNRLAEEYAMLDVLSRGRLVCAFPLGVGQEFWANAAQINPATARQRFRESMDILIRAWTEPGPFTYDGEFYNYKYLNVWPRPYQQPHPPIFITGSGSRDTVEYAAQMGYGYSIVPVPRPVQLRTFETYRASAAAAGRQPQPDQLLWACSVYVGDTDQAAERDSRGALESAQWGYSRTTGRYQLPPGYTSVEDYRRRQSGGGRLHGDWQNAIATGRFAFGAADTVAQQLEEWITEMASNRVVILLRFGTLSRELVHDNIVRFTREVMPRLKALSGSVDGDDHVVADGQRTLQNGVTQATLESVGVGEATAHG
ncbi:MAG: LLM class flavin-dependent oxidoreductase [Chloroflexi bacterium]|nr:LLM class flavin-dependent oxidoreductase [Chloroflexota bacterium]